MYLQKTRWTTAKKQTFNGIKFDSGFEARYAKDLHFRQAAGEILSWEAHVKIPLTVGKYIVCDYFIDFVVHFPDGSTEYVETKGWPSPVWRLKWKLFEALYSDKENVRLIVEKQGYFKTTKARKIKY